MLSLVCSPAGITARPAEMRLAGVQSRTHHQRQALQANRYVRAAGLGRIAGQQRSTPAIATFKMILRSAMTLQHHRVLVCLFTALLAQAPCLHAAEPVVTRRLDSDRLGRLDQSIENYIERKQLAGAVVYVAHNGRVEHLKSFGMQDVESGTKMPVDAIFRIASMSKAVTTVAALILYEEGRFLLNDPVSKYIPEFANMSVAVAPVPGAPLGTKYSTVPAKRPVTIRDLMCHTAGLSYGDGATLAADDYKAANVQSWYLVDHDEPIGDVVKRLAKLPLHAQPGEAWVYGYGTDVLGYLIERVSDQPLDRFLEERVFKPLKMTDTGFFLPKEKQGRLAIVYARSSTELKRGDQGAFVDGPRRCFSGGAGLLSTATDYGRFLQMLLNGGELDGVCLLSPKTVELMRQNHVGDKYRRDVSAFGLGFWINDDPGYYGEISSKGAYGWGSAYYPQYLVDPQEKLVALILTQLRPAIDVDLNTKFKVLVYQSLVQSPSAP